MDQDVKKEFGKVKNGFKAAKKEFKAIRKEFKTIRKEISKLASKEYVSKLFDLRFEYYMAEMKETMVTKEYFMTYMSTLEEMIREVRDSRNSRLLFEGQFVDLDDQVNNHEGRIKILEHEVLHP